MNSKSSAILYTSLLFGVLNTNSLYAASNSDTQTLKLKVAKVALIKLDRIDHTFTFTPGIHTAQQYTKVAISSNDPAARLHVHATDLPQGLKLKIAANAHVCKQQMNPVTQDPNSFSCLVGMTATKNGQLTLTTTRNDSQRVPDGDYSANLIYTLTD